MKSNHDVLGEFRRVHQKRRKAMKRRLVHHDRMLKLKLNHLFVELTVRKIEHLAFPAHESYYEKYAEAYLCDARSGNWNLV